MNRLLAAALSRPLGTLAACVCLAVLGLLAALDLKISLYPSRPFPVITVTTLMPSTGPSEVETQLTRPLEEGMRGVLGVRKVFSRSSAGRSQVTLELHGDSDVSTAAQQVRTRLARLGPDLPWGARPPVISLYNPSQQPVAALAVSGGGSLGQAGDWAREVLAPRLRRVDGVADVIVSGAPEPEILVDCDPGRLRALGLSVSDVARALGRENSSLPGGFLRAGGEHTPLRTQGRVSTAREVAALPVAARHGSGVVLLGSIAKVTSTHRDPEQINRLGGKPVVALSLQQAWGADLGRLWQRVSKVLDSLPDGAKGYKVEVIYSRARSLDQALDRLGWVALIAAGAAALVLFWFLRSLILTLVALTAIPFSLCTALLFMRLAGQQLDLLALSGLTLALGILVDNAVVVIEAVHHHWHQGRDRVRGALEGVWEVAWPVSHATLTTLAAFLPLLALSDQVRRHMSSFFWGMSLSLTASLVAALVLIPVLMIMTGGLTRRSAGVRKSPGERAYGAVLTACQARPWRALMAGGLFLALGAAAYTQLPFDSGGVLGTKGLMVMAVSKPGTPMKTTAAMVGGLEGGLIKLSGVKRVHTRIWANQARITVTLIDRADEKAVLARAKALLPKESKLQYHLLPLGQASAAAGGSSLTLNLFGPALPSLGAYANRIRTRLIKLPQISEVVLKLGNPQPELRLDLDHRLLGLYGLSASEVARETRAHLTGPVALKVIRGDREVDVRVRSQAPGEKGLGALSAIYLPVKDRGLIPLSEVVKPKLAPAPSELFREDHRRVVRVTLVAKTRDALKAAELTEATLAGIKAPPGCYWEMDEAVSRITKTRGQMLGGAALAVLLVYLVMVAASESWAVPLVVLAAAPFAASGAVLGLWALGHPVSMPVYLGAVILAGMMVNTGLVMIDAMSRRQRQGQSPAQAARSGALRRLRPVAMSTLSTLAAGLPLFLDQGQGSSAWAPLALTLSAGLVSSSLFALLITPALYPWAARLDAWLSRRS